MDKILSQDIYDVMQTVLHNGGMDHPDNIVDHIVSNFGLEEIDFIIEMLDNNDVVKVHEGLSKHKLTHKRK
tara:strand:+ start:710 stop:922 length:213 start_codon:yes stop_codon:yes gene_type:complete